MRSCDMCGATHRETEVLCFDHRDRSTPEDTWRVAAVCDKCRRGRLIPALRHLFEDGATNLKPWDDDFDDEVPKPLGAAYRAFETESGTTHIASNVQSGPAFGWRSYCTAACGVSAFAEPEGRSRPLRGQGESVVCGRCAKARPDLVIDE